MNCLKSSLTHFLNDSNKFTYVGNILKDSNYTIYDRTTPIYLNDLKINCIKLDNPEQIKKDTIIGIYIKEKEYLNLFAYHFFYIGEHGILSSWHTMRSLTKEEYELNEYETSWSETEIEDEVIEEQNYTFDYSLLFNNPSICSLFGSKKMLDEYHLYMYSKC